MPRAGNIEGGGVLGWTYPCKNAATDPNDYVYVIVQKSEKGFEQFCNAIGFQDWLTNPDFSTDAARNLHKKEVWARIAEYTKTRTKFEVTNELGPKGVPVGPVLSTKEIMNTEDLYDGNTLVRINQGGGTGEFVTVGCPFTMSTFQPEYGPCPSLGGNNAEVLQSLGYTQEEIDNFAKTGVTEPLPDGKM